MSNIRSSVMLGNLSMGAWAARVSAKDVARAAEAKANAKNGTYTASKKLADGVDELVAIKSKQSEVRAEWYKMGERWFDNGTRAFKGVKLIDVTQQMLQWDREHDALVERFMRVYPSMVAGKQYDLGSDYNPRDYPPADVVRSKFYFKFDYFTIPDSADIRLMEGIPPEEVEAMVEEAEKQMKERLHASLSSAATKLFKCVEKMHEKLSVKVGEPGHIFRDSLVDNLVDLIEIMPNLNIIDDPALKALTVEAKKLTMYSPEVLREDATARELAAKKAGDLASKLSSMFNTDGDEE